MHLIDVDTLRNVRLSRGEMEYLIQYIDENEDIDIEGDIVVDKAGYEDLRRLLCIRRNGGAS